MARLHVSPTDLTSPVVECGLGQSVTIAVDPHGQTADFMLGHRDPPESFPLRIPLLDRHDYAPKMEKTLRLPRSARRQFTGRAVRRETGEEL